MARDQEVQHGMSAPNFGGIMKSDGPLLDAVRTIASEVATKHADAVDSEARFPTETIAALKEASVLSAAVPKELGGGGCGMRDLAKLSSTLGRACGSSAMVMTMHHIQVACLARHGLDSPFFRQYLRDLVKHQYLLASMTSEVGTSGEMRSSICAVERDKAGRFVLNKDATTGSYCAQADAILVTGRRAPSSPANDQVLALVRQGDFQLEQTTTWDALGMRGTCSPGFRLKSSAPEEQILPGAFADSAAQSMVPYSHILWSSLWWGIAADALARAGSYVRADARKKPGVVPLTATRLAEVSAQLQSMRHDWQSMAGEFDELSGTADGMKSLLSIGWALKLNNLKVTASTAAPHLVHGALQIVGLLGYKNDTPYSVGRHYRDVLSASLMVSNERISSKSASMLLVHKEV
jgi:acyl-CoA dehydrogenase